MAIADPDKIWPELEATGVEEVHKKLAMKLYAEYKIPVIEEWLRRKDYPTYMYHEFEAPNGQIFKAHEVPSLEKKGWVDSPTKFGKGFRSKSRRAVRAAFQFYASHWQWVIGTIVALLAIWIQYITSGK